MLVICLLWQNCLAKFVGWWLPDEKHRHQMVTGDSLVVDLISYIVFFSFGNLPNNMYWI